MADDLTASFSDATNYWLDARELMQIAEDANTSDLVAGLSVYSGDLLPGFYDDWVVLKREYFQAMFERGMTRLLHLLETERRWAEVVDWAERWIALGQSPESAYRSLMVAHSALHDPAKAMAAHDRYLRALQRLGLEPSGEISALRDTNQVTP